MTDDELRAELAQLGITEKNLALVAVLPLVQVAWADGKVQSAERKIILKAAENFQVNDPDSKALLESWIKKDPGFDAHDRALKVLRALAARKGAFGVRVTPRTLEGVITLCERVAEATGGLFGLMFTMEASERDAVANIAQALVLKDGKVARPGWDTLIGELDD
jgi:tellurite resistance protein